MDETAECKNKDYQHICNLFSPLYEVNWANGNWKKCSNVLQNG